MFIASCPVTGQNQDAGFFFTRFHRAFIEIGKTFKAKQSQLSCIFVRQMFQLLYNLCNPLLASLTYIQIFLTFGSCFAAEDISHESSKNKRN